MDRQKEDNNTNYIKWIEFAFVTSIALLAGWPFFVRGRQSVEARNLRVDTDSMPSSATTKKKGTLLSSR